MMRSVSKFIYGPPDPKTLRSPGPAANKEREIRKFKKFKKLPYERRESKSADLSLSLSSSVEN